MVTQPIARITFLVLAWLAAFAASPSRADAQPQPTADHLALRDAIVERFEVVRLTDGIALAPKDASADVRLVQLENGAIAIDGAMVTGQELNDRLGDDADLIVRVSYLDPELRVTLFGGNTRAAATPRDATPEPPAPPPLDRRTTSSGIVRIVGSVRVDADECVRGDVVALGGPLTVDGEVTGDVVVIGGPARFGPDAEVDGEVTVIGGPVDRARTAAIRGGVNEVGFGAVDFGDLEIGEWFRFGGAPMMGHGWYRGGWNLAGDRPSIDFSRADCLRGRVRGAGERGARGRAFRSGAAQAWARRVPQPGAPGPDSCPWHPDPCGVDHCIPLLVLLPFAILGLLVAMVVGLPALPTHSGGG